MSVSLNGSSIYVYVRLVVACGLFSTAPVVTGCSAATPRGNSAIPPLPALRAADVFLGWVYVSVRTEQPDLTSVAHRVEQWAHENRGVGSCFP